MAEVYRSASLQAARIAGEDPAMDAAAQVVLARARAVATQHRLTGAYLTRFGTERTRGKRGVTDRLVFNDDPGAVSIEFGHTTTTGRLVPGQHILGKAAGTR